MAEQKQTGKNRKKGHPVRITIIVLLIALIGLTAFLYYRPFHSCSEFLEAYQTGDEKNVTSLLDAGEIGGEVKLDGYAEILSERMDFKIKGMEKLMLPFADTCNIQAEITNVDFAALVEQQNPWEFISGENEEAYQGALLVSVLSETAPMSVYPVDVMMVKTDGAWKVRMTSTLSNALLGNFPYYYQQLIEEYLRGDTE